MRIGIIFAGLGVILITQSIGAQIVLEPVVTGTVMKETYTYFGTYRTFYRVAGPWIDLFDFGSGSMYEHHFVGHGVMEFPVDETVDGGDFPTFQMTASNWTARIEAIEFNHELSFAPGLYQMNDGYEDGELNEDDFNASTLEDLIAILHPGSPGEMTVSNIDVTDSLRNDIFGAGMGDPCSGYVLKVPWGSHYMATNHDSLRISVTLNETPTPLTTATPTQTPTITPTLLPPEWRGVQLILPGSPFTGGDLFRLRAQCMGDPKDTAANLHVILDVYGEYWFHPGWTEIPQYETVTLNPSKPVVSFILDFIWPDNIQGSVDGLCFWGAILDQETSDLIGDFDRIEFGYQ